MVAEPDDLKELDALREAIGREDWANASQQARELLAQWRTIKSSVLLFAPAEADAPVEAFESVFVRLVEDLEQESVDAFAVRKAVNKVLAFLRSGTVDK